MVLVAIISGGVDSCVGDGVVGGFSWNVVVLLLSAT